MFDGGASDSVPVLSLRPLCLLPSKMTLISVTLSLGISPALDFRDLPDHTRSFVCIFADDNVLYKNINSLTDCQILQDDLNSLALCHRLIGK